MDLSKIDEVLETIDIREVNDALEGGWVLLGVAPGRGDEDQPWVKYSLGFPGRPAVE